MRSTTSQRYRSLGLCVHCGAARCPGSTVFCERHLLENRVKSRLRNRRLQGCQPWRPGGRGRPPLGREGEVAA
ncbi:MAG: hypothetical protein IT200_17070 [Thermoleophilia bacterium]|nr:hypothetical protein [Thermoleophilia bacterium]